MGGGIYLAPKREKEMLARGLYDLATPQVVGEPTRPLFTDQFKENFHSASLISTSSSVDYWFSLMFIPYGLGALAPVQGLKLRPVCSSGRFFQFHRQSLFFMQFYCHVHFLLWPYISLSVYVNGI